MSPWRAPRPGSVLLAFALSLALVAAACGGDNEPAAGADPAGDEAGKANVATTVAPITSIVANIAGDLADVTGIVPAGADSHTFDPPPSAARILAEADVIFVNGLMLEESTVELAQQNMKDGARLVALGDEVLPEEDWIYDFSFPEDEGMPNPHLWTDPTCAKRYAEVVKNELAHVDPDNAAAYEGNYDAFAALIDEFDEAMRADFDSLPPERRKLITYHDAYPYFAQTYGWEVLGAIQVASFDDPTPREVAALIDQIKAEEVPAIFGSEVFPSPVLAQIGRETGVRYVDVLRDDVLPGEPGDAEHSWLGMMRFNFVTMVEALGGDASALRAFEVRDVAPDRAHYPR